MTARDAMRILAVAVAMIVAVTLPVSSAGAGQLAGGRTPTVDPGASATASRVDLGTGDSGLRVAQLQLALKADGYTVQVDGRFGKQTARALRHFQHSNGLVVDAVAGPVTLAALLGPATATAPAVRVTPNSHQTPVPPSSDVESIIRSIWPPEVADWAIKIATRESNLQPGVRNSCCIGLFQIHWYAHQSWLSDYGANQPSDLFDPTINARVAYVLFQHAGVHPWDCHGQCKDIPL